MSNIKNVLNEMLNDKDGVIKQLNSFSEEELDFVMQLNHYALLYLSVTAINSIVNVMGGKNE